VAFLNSYIHNRKKKHLLKAAGGSDVFLDVDGYNCVSLLKIFFKIELSRFESMVGFIFNSVCIGVVLDLSIWLG